MQTKTPSHIKWLLNERPALAGELARIDRHLQHLHTEIPRLQSALQTCLEARSKYPALRQPLLERILALDATIQQFDTKLNPEARGIVQAWAGRYGQRGALKAFVIETIQSAAPNPISKPVLTLLAIARFEWSLAFRGQRGFNRRILQACHRLAQAGLVTHIKGSPGCWRWGQDMPSLAFLSQERRAD